MYNEAYIRDIFYSSETQKGIFSLSKENSNARKQIDDANKNLTIQTRLLSENEKLIEDHTKNWEKTKKTTFSTLWDIKKKYYGA